LIFFTAIKFCRDQELVYLQIFSQCCRTVHEGIERKLGQNGRLYSCFNHRLILSSIYMHMGNYYKLY